MIKTIIVTQSSSLLFPLSLSPLQPHWPPGPFLEHSRHTPRSGPLCLTFLFSSLEHCGSCHHLLSSNVTFPERPTVTVLFKLPLHPYHLVPSSCPFSFSYSTYHHLQPTEFTYGATLYFSPDPRIQAPQRQGLGSIMFTDPCFVQ